MDVLHGEQLRMFMRPAEIKQAVTTSPDSEGFGRRGMNAMWKYKEEESKQEGWIGWGGSGMYKELRQRQVQDPVALHVTPGIHMKHVLTMGEGHHRVAAAHAVERASRGRIVHWVPVDYKEGQPG